MPRKPAKPLRIDVRDLSIPAMGGRAPGRVAISSRTTAKPEFRQRDAAVRQLIKAGEWGILERIITPGPERLHIATVQRELAAGNLDALRPKAPLGKGPAPLLIGATVDRMLRTKAAIRSEGTEKVARLTCAQLETALGVVRDRYGRILRDVAFTDPAITTERLEAWLHGPKQGGKPWAPRTQVVRHAYAQQLWEVAIRQEADSAEREDRKARLTRNPWKHIEPGQITATRVIFLTAPERDSLLRTLAGRPLAAFMAVAYHAGLRLGEAVNLRTGIDVDLDAGLLRIQPRPGEYKWEPKTRRGTREVPINRTLRRLLEEHVAAGYAGARYFFRLPGLDRPLGDTSARRWWINAYEAAGIKWGRSDVDSVVHHTGRHTFCSLLVQQGISPLIVGKLAGDKYEQIIATYGHLTPTNLVDAVKLLESET